MINKKGALEFSFAWIFAIVAGVFILILAIYGVIKFINLSQTEIGAESAKEIGVLTNPLESVFESAKRSMITTGSEIRIYTGCSNTSVFGKQIIGTSGKNYEQWGDMVDVSFQNRYVFSKNPVEGKSFYMFSKPLEIPFKVADLIYLTSTRDKYCFINPPDDIEDEIEDLTGKELSTEESESKYENFFIADRKRECPDGSITVCFGGSERDCDTYVFGDYVQKSNGRMYYEEDALMYAAIFSDKEDYECQLDRLVNRAEQLFELYREKSAFVLHETGCNSELDVELMQMLSLLKGFEDSQDFYLIYILAEEIDKKNEYAECKLW